MHSEIGPVSFRGHRNAFAVKKIADFKVSQAFYDARICQQSQQMLRCFDNNLLVLLGQT